MCGVAALCAIQRDLNADDQAALQRMAHAMRFRGPDAQGIWMSGHLGLTHTRLAIVDLDERSNQPIENAHWVLSYNGEIVNFRDLREKLQTEDGYDFRTASDTEVLLAALTAWGLQKTLPLIAGMFAFVAQNKQTGDVYAVRDPMGIKPLFVSQRDDGTWMFASTVGAILAAGTGGDRQVNQRALSSLFYLGAPFTEETVFEGISRVAPATCVHIAPDGERTDHCYWKPRYNPDFTIDDLAEIVREYQFSDVPMALFLSGGVDSTFLACVTDNFDCFHLTSAEEVYAAQVAQRFGRKLHSVAPSLDVYEDDFRRAIELHGEPLFSAGIPAAVSRKCVELGYKVALSANGADELFGGYFRTPMPELGPLILPEHERPPNDRNQARFFQEQFSHIFRHPGHLVFDEAFGSRIDIADAAAAWLEACHLPDFPPSASYRWFELMSYVLHDLNPTLDAASMAHSLEVRVPFLDHRVVEGVLSMSADQLMDSELGRKKPLKEYIVPYMGKKFLERTKLGFTIDDKKLAIITNMVGENVPQASAAAGVSLSETAVNSYHARDRKYLSNSLFSYHLWKTSNLHQGGMQGVH